MTALIYLVTIKRIGRKLAIAALLDLAAIAILNSPRFTAMCEAWDARTADLGGDD